MSLQREREGRDEILHSGDQFGTFRGFGSFGSRRSVFPSLFGGRDPFDDPFFIRPFGSLFESNTYGPPPVSSYKMETNSSKGIVIEELDDGDQGHEDKASGSDKDNRQKYSASSIEPSVEHPDDIANEGKSKKITYKKLEGSHPQSRSYSFQTSKVTYGGIDGAYYTSSRTRRAGHDGVVIEEAKEADKTTGQATHRISRGIRNKGHSLTRKLNVDGKVDTMQTLHNLEEEELAGFEEAWNSNVDGCFSRSKDACETHGSSSREHKGGAGGNSGGWLLSHSEQVPKARGTGVQTESGTNSGRAIKFYTFLETGIVTLSLLPHFIAFFSDGEIPGTPGTLATTFLAFVLNLAFALSVLGFLVMHISMVAANTTTIEAYEKKTTPKWRYDLGRKKNFQQVFGIDKRYWFIPAYSEEDMRKMPALHGLEFPSKPEFNSQEF